MSIKQLLNKEDIKTNVLHFFGDSYNVLVYEADKNKITVMDREILVDAKSLKKDYLQTLIYQFYKTRLKKYVEERIDEIKKVFGIDFPLTLQFKNVKTYFGECFYKSKKIYFSNRLAKYEPKYIDSVIYHELAHFFYHNHGKEFYMLLERLYPGYKRIQHELKEIKYNDIY